MAQCRAARPIPFSRSTKIFSGYHGQLHYHDLPATGSPSFLSIFGNISGGFSNDPLLIGQVMQFGFNGPTIAQFGLDQQRRREQGQINAQQHLDENMAFIKQSTDKRLERLKKRMATE